MRVIDSNSHIFKSIHLLTGTREAAEWLKSIQDELANILRSHGIPLDNDNNSQISNVISSITSPDVNKDNILYILTGSIGTDQLIQELNERIDLIDAPETGLIYKYDGLTNRIGDVEGSIVELNTLSETSTSSLVQSYLGLKASIEDPYTGLTTKASTTSLTVANSDLLKAVAGAINQTSTTLNGRTTTVEEVVSSVDGLGGAYTLKIDTNGNISGFGMSAQLINGLPDSEFSIVANRFKVVAPGNTPNDGKQVFVVNADTGQIGINGSVIVGGGPASEVASLSDVSYKVEIISSNGSFLRKTNNPDEVLTVLTARVYKGATDITDTITLDRFKWTRVSADSVWAVEDSNWNTSHNVGYNAINVTSQDVHIRAVFNCEIREI